MLRTIVAHRFAGGFDGTGTGYLRCEDFASKGLAKLLPSSIRTALPRLVSALDAAIGVIPRT